MQDQETGAAANRWGRETARALALRLGARMNGRTSNEATLEGRRVVIKCAAAGTNSVGVTYQMLDRIDEVVAAFQSADGAFVVRALSVPEFRAHLRPTRSLGPSAGKVGIVQRDAFEASGRMVSTLRLPPPTG